MRWVEVDVGDWRTRAVMICDGTTVTFGALFDLQSSRVCDFNWPGLPID